MSLSPGGIATAAVVSTLCAAGTAHAAPLIDSTLLKDGAVTGRTVELQVRASDRLAPVTGMVVGFGTGESGYGLSSCLPPDSRGRRFGPVAAPGRRVTLAAPHVYSRTGKRSVVTNVTSGGCTLGRASTLQTVLLNLVRPGSARLPIVTSPTVTVPVGQLAPALPGLEQLPLGGTNVGLPGVPAVNLPVIPPIQLPVIPPIQLPTLPPIQLPLSLLPKATGAGGCPDRYRWYRNTRAAERRAKASQLCLLNAERRRRGLRPMRANAKLAQAAEAHSRTMVKGRFFAHVGPGTQTPSMRLRASRYIPARGSWVVGENIGFGTGILTRPASIHSAWMHSTPHRAAMLSPRFREVGFGLHPGSPYQNRGVTFTADFGAKR